MKNTYFLLSACIVFLFTACEPKFDLNAPYKDITVVYAVLDHSLDTNYVKIYKGFQSRDGQTKINAQTPDSIYYKRITVELKELNTNRPVIKMFPTNDFPRDSGLFYYQDKRIIYYTAEKLSPDAVYEITIKNSDNEKVIRAETPLVGKFNIKGSSIKTYSLTGPSNRVEYEAALNAFDYEIHVNFLYFEVEDNGNITQHRIVKNITPNLGTKWSDNTIVQIFTNTFFEDIAYNVKPNPSVLRFIGTPQSPNCLQFEAWAVEENFVKFLISNKPSNSFIQINKIYTNIETDDDSGYGFFSSRIKSATVVNGISISSIDSIVFGSKTRHLRFNRWVSNYQTQ